MVELNYKNFNKEKNIGFYMNHLYTIPRLKVYNLHKKFYNIERMLCHWMTRLGGLPFVIEQYIHIKINKYIYSWLFITLSCFSEVALFGYDVQKIKLS